MKNNRDNLRLLCILFFTWATSLMHAAHIDTLNTFSRIMNKEIPALVVTPDTYTPDRQLPVVYLLHGYGNSSLTGWVAPETGVEKYADMYGIILVVPDGGTSSWYFDSPVDPQYQYETYIVRELIPLIDQKYATMATPAGRAITGLSMGGHGALYLSFRNQDIFGAAGSTSGGVDIRPFPNNWDISKRLGSYSKHPDNWEKNTVINMLHLLTPNSLALIIDCGTEDFFYKVNCELHEQLKYRNIPHSFISRPGAHNWEYWISSIQYQMLFFNDFFKKNKGKS